ncbi:MAG TPA: peptidase M16, partial [Alcanivorax sp.]|nr:peptidase M16 [Alcanivorax sp.]
PRGDAAPELARAERLKERVTEHVDFPSNQTHILIGNQATWRGHPDHVPLYVGNYILGGGGFASLLTQKVREEKGYVYGVSSFFKPMAAGGPFILQLQTANDNADQALALSMGIVRDFIENGPTEAQLEAAKANILGSRALETADNSDIIGQLGAIGFYDLPLDYLQRFNQRVEAVTVEEIRAAFQRALDADRLAIVSIGPRAPQTDRQ